MKRIKQPKKCSECGKALRDWNKSGLCAHHYVKWYCKSSKGKAKRKEWRKNNPEKVKVWQKKYYEGYKEHLKEYASNYYLKKKKKRMKYAREQYQKKKENVTPKE